LGVAGHCEINWAALVPARTAALSVKGFFESDGAGKLGDENFIRAILAAYNSGQGNVIKNLLHGRDVDSTTYQGDYSKEVMKFRYEYWDMFGEK
jgi:hypothetical protein